MRWRVITPHYKSTFQWGQRAGGRGLLVTTAWFKQRGGKYFDALRHLNEQLAHMYLNERKYKGFYNPNLLLKYIR